MSHAFVSYVREDDFVVRYIVEVLKKNGVSVWVDKENIAPGQRWRDAVRTAIREGKYFIPILSRNWVARDRTVANEEIILAIDELRQRPRDRAWFIPLRIDECEMPDNPIGAGETLRDIQYIDFPSLGWTEALRRLFRSLGIENPILEMGSPLGSGLPSAVDIKGGALIYTKSNPPIPGVNGLIFSVIGGSCVRTEEGHVLAYVKTRAPMVQLQELNSKFGLDSFYAVSKDGYISADPQKPNRFEFETSGIFPENMPMDNPFTGQKLALPFDMPFRTNFVALGVLEKLKFKGDFTSTLTYQVQGNLVPITIDGTFDIDLAFSDGPSAR